MRAFLAAVLSVMAVGVLLIAYGLLVPRASAVERVPFPDSRGYGYQAVPVGYTARAPSTAPPAYRPAVYDEPVVYAEPQAPLVRTTRAASVPQRSAARVEQRPGRNWKKTALVIGGSTATGAGIGALAGGKKGALIGAAIGGGASTLYESRR